MRKLLLLLFVARAACASTTITLLHFSDYHSHALPFYSEDRPAQGGIARAVGFMKREHARGALVFSGGDMINKGSPAWSDKYRCAEWPWLNGVVDAMAFGNHEPDYGYADFMRCRGELRYPVLSANTNGFQHYEIFERRGIRIGVFALAGPDFKSLVRMPELAFGDSLAAARDVVRALRETEHVDYVVMIGHEHTADDYALARAVPGIDLIFGSHSHEKHELTRIDGTQTWFIAPYQYLTYISRVTVLFDRHHMSAIRGGLVPVDSRMRPDKQIEARVAEMQRALESDPQYASLFATVGTLDRALSLDALAAASLNAMRNAVHADVALSTISSFRQPLPPGPITLELLRAAMPYDNEIVVCEMRGDALQKLVEAVERRKGSDSFCYVARPEAIDPAKTYRVATTDYVARIAYRDSFPCEPRKSGVRVREVTKGFMLREDAASPVHLP
jgi:5'-nucleotidase / UDP-sugar diphosphatase